MDVFNTVADLFNVRGVLLALLVFVPLERILALHPSQKVFRRGWGNDVVYVFVNALLTKLGLGLVIVGTIVMAEWTVPSSFRATVAAQPLWLQIVEVVVLADL